MAVGREARRGVLWMLVAAVSLSGCAADRSTEPSASSAGRRVPTDPKPRNAYPAALLPGTLTVVDPAADPLCTYVRAGNVNYLIWPLGYRADTTGSRILRPDGSVAATVGEKVSLGGGAWALGPADNDTCPLGERWITAPS
jgi:hypothetical protein